MMPESPDFEAIAAALCDSSTEYANKQQGLTEQLRQVWNARGAADIAKIAEVMDTYNDRSAILGRTLRALDR